MSGDDTTTRLTAELTDGSRIELGWSGTRASIDTAALTRALEAARNELESALDRPTPMASVATAPEALGAPSRHGIVGQSPAMLQLFRMIDKVAPTLCTVLITGENGTGKELVAHAIHTASPRANKPFVAANCSAFNDNLLESELFGHRRGSFTGAVHDKRGLFEEADGGTFLLDEVGDMSPALQVKLLRVLQEGTLMPVGGTQTKKVDVRIIAATNKDLATMVREGTFREDLYYRLHVVALRTPPLRDRGADLDVLIQHFLARLGQRDGRVKTLAPQTLERLRAHPWPGNVRELQNEIERIWVLSGDERTIGPEHLSPAVARASLATPRRQAEASLMAQAEPPLTDGANEPLAASLERVERSLIERALHKVQGNRTRAAQALGISRRNLIRKLQALGLAGQDEADGE